MPKTASIVLLATSVAALVNPTPRLRPTIRRSAAVSDLYSAPPYEPSWEELTQVPVFTKVVYEDNREGLVVYCQDTDLISGATKSGKFIGVISLPLKQRADLGWMRNPS